MHLYRDIFTQISMRLIVYFMHIYTQICLTNHEEDGGLEGDTVTPGKGNMSNVRDEKLQITLYRVRKC